MMWKGGREGGRVGEGGRQKDGSGSFGLAVAVACCGSLSFGYHISVVNASLRFLLQDLGAADSSLAGGIVVSTLLATAAVGSMTAGAIASRCGRRFAFKVAAVPFIAGSLLSASSRSVLLMAVGRGLTGLGMGLVSCTVLLYISEVSPTEHRGLCGTMAQLATSSGFFLALLVGLPVAQFRSWWRVMFAIGSGPPFLLLLGASSVLPESPRWLFQHGQVDASLRAASFLLGESRARELIRDLSIGQEVEARLAQEQQTAKEELAMGERQEVGSAGAAAAAAAAASDISPFALGRSSGKAKGGYGKTRRKQQRFFSATRLLHLMVPDTVQIFDILTPALGIGAALYALQQFSGINTVLYYSSLVFHRIGIESDVAASALLGLLKLAAVLVASYFIDRVGRRLLLMVSFSLMGASMFLLSLTLSLPISPTLEAAMAVFGTVCYVGAFSCGVGPIPAILLPELFPLRNRAVSISMCMIVHWACDFLVGFSFLSLVDAFGLARVYLLFGSSCFIAVVFVHRFINETKRRSLEELERSFSQKTSV